VKQLFCESKTVETVSDVLCYELASVCCCWIIILYIGSFAHIIVLTFSPQMVRYKCLIYTFVVLHVRKGHHPHGMAKAQCNNFFLCVNF